jgi:uncharacterized protein (DUF983 family)
MSVIYNLAKSTMSETAVRCPEPCCNGHLQQDTYSNYPRCNTCLKEFIVIEAGERTPDKVTAKDLLEEIEEFKDRLHEIGALAR